MSGSWEAARSALYPVEWQHGVLNGSIECEREPAPPAASLTDCRGEGGATGCPAQSPLYTKRLHCTGNWGLEQAETPTSAAEHTPLVASSSWLDSLAGITGQPTGLQLDRTIPGHPAG